MKLCEETLILIGPKDLINNTNSHPFLMQVTSCYGTVMSKAYRQRERGGG